jgi:hypothetical protein
MVEAETAKRAGSAKADSTEQISDGVNAEKKEPAASKKRTRDAAEDEDGDLPEAKRVDSKDENSVQAEPVADKAEAITKKRARDEEEGEGMPEAKRVDSKD